MTQWATAVRLAMADLLAERLLALCTTLALAAVLAPLVILAGLRAGVVQGLREVLLEDPRVREVATAANRSFDAGLLARLAAQDLEFELLTLVEGAGAMDGVRHAAPEGEESGSWSLEYEGAGLRVYVHLTLVEGRHRLDGWVVPAQALTVELRTEGHDEPVVTTADELGRFAVSPVRARIHLGWAPWTSVDDGIAALRAPVGDGDTPPGRDSSR